MKLTQTKWTKKNTTGSVNSPAWWSYSPMYRFVRKRTVSAVEIEKKNKQTWKYCQYRQKKKRWHLEWARQLRRNRKSDGMEVKICSQTSRVIIIPFNYSGRRRRRRFGRSSADCPENKKKSQSYLRLQSSLWWIIDQTSPNSSSTKGWRLRSTEVTGDNQTQIIFRNVRNSTLAGCVELGILSTINSLPSSTGFNF